MEQGFLSHSNKIPSSEKPKQKHNNKKQQQQQQKKKDFACFVLVTPL